MLFSILISSHISIYGEWFFFKFYSPERRKKVGTDSLTRIVIKILNKCTEKDEDDTDSKLVKQEVLSLVVCLYHTGIEIFLIYMLFLQSALC